MQGKYVGLLLLATVTLSGELAQEILQELTEAGLHGQRAAAMITKLQNEAQHQPAPQAPVAPLPPAAPAAPTAAPAPHVPPLPPADIPPEPQ
jgi:hypothetical protein